MSALKNDLATVTKTLKQLSRKTEQLSKKVDKIEKAKAVRKPKAKKAAKAKAKRRVVARRKVAKRKAVAKKKAPKKRAAKKRVTAKRPAAKRTAKQSASEVLLDLMRKGGGKKGVATALLQKKTGFNNQKIRDNIYKLTKRGKIKRVGRGVYAVK
jgi:membrane protein involved in colicin uptake